ncbi:MAG: hypothetical protein H8E86_00515, partial [Planctomycetes bacterium]|nr:hypothetical protein [Planctomycetota bacterium]
MKKCSAVIFFFTILIFSLWVLGLLLTDRWAWSQWLSWIPAFFLLVLLLCSVGFCIASRAKTHAVTVGCIFVLVFYWYVFVSNAFTNIENGGALRIVGWTMSYSKQKVSKESAKEVVRLHGDITLLTHGWIVRGEPVIKEWLGVDNKRIINGPFTILTRLPILEVRTIIASDGVYLSMFKFDTTQQLGEPLVLWAIDLPSKITIPKIKTAERVNRLLASLDVQRPDIVMGDFNMTRNSYSMKTMFPELIDASTVAGVGLLASFPMNFPLYHIDHTLLRK